MEVIIIKVLDNTRGYAVPRQDCEFERETVDKNAKWIHKYHYETGSGKLPEVGKIWKAIIQAGEIKLISEHSDSLPLAMVLVTGKIVSWPFEFDDTGALPANNQRIVAVRYDPCSYVDGMIDDIIEFTPYPPGLYYYQKLPQSQIPTSFPKDVIPLHIISLHKKAESYASQGYHLDSSINLVSLKFRFPQSFGSRNSLPLYQSIVPEYPEKKFPVVAYPMDKLKLGANEVMLANFRTSDLNLALSVVNIDVLQVESDHFEKISSQGFTFYNNMKGDFLYSSIFAIDCPDNYYIGYIPIPINVPKIFGYKFEVGEYLRTWMWQSAILDTDGTLKSVDVVAVTSFRFLQTLSKPKAPWGVGRNPDPLVDLISLTCKWAGGATTSIQAATKITRHLNDSKWFLYSSSSSLLTEVNADSNVIFAGMLSEILNGYYGIVNLASCKDLSSIMLLLSNSIGLSLKLLHITPINGPLVTNSIQPLGRTEMHKEHSFNDHWVAFLPIGEGYKTNPKQRLIFDPCFRVYNEKHEIIQLIGFNEDEYLKLLFSTPSNKIECTILNTPIKINP